MVGRRELLTGTLGVTLLYATRTFAATRRATARAELGPFYRKSAPNRAQLRGDRDVGLPLSLAGTVYDSRGDVVPDAVVEIWHADSAGRYDVTGDKFRAALKLDAKAAYSIDTVMPGHYPDRVCQHVHYLVRAPGHRPLVTQLYFATDPVFDGDPTKNAGKDPLITSVDLIRPVSLVDEDSKPRARVAFDLVLERL